MAKKKIIVILLTALVFLSVAVLGVSAVYRVDEVTVVATTLSNEAKTEAEQLQKRLEEVYARKSMFFVERDLAEEIVEQFPYFRITDFEKSYPNRLIVDIREDEETYAVPCLNAEEGYYILGADGTVLGVRTDYSNRSDVTGKRKNVLITGLSVVGEKGGTLSGDTSLAYTLAFCQKVNELLDGIQSNILQVDVVKGGSLEDTVVLKLTTFEGVKIYVRNPSLHTEEKARLAIEKYFALSDSERTTGMIVALDKNGTPSIAYSQEDEFEGIIN